MWEMLEQVIEEYCRLLFPDNLKIMGKELSVWAAWGTWNQETGQNDFGSSFPRKQKSLVIDNMDSGVKQTQKWDPVLSLPSCDVLSTLLNLSAESYNED